MKKVAVKLIIYLLCNYSAFAQCSEETYELALAKAGSDVVLVRDFKVRLKEGNKRNPIPASRFSVLMQKGLTYRFTISKDTLANYEPVLQLFDRSELLGNTYNKGTGKSEHTFDYLCSRTGNYQVLISIPEGKEGCAVGLMAMVADSAFYAKGIKIPENDKYVLYVGIENPLRIYTDQKQVKKKTVTSDKGNVILKDSLYYIFVPSAGPVKINVKLYNNTDTIIEELDQSFKVVPLPAPSIFIEGTEKDYILLYSIGPVVRLAVKPALYTILEFYISDDLSFNSGIKSNDEYFTQDMLNFIKQLEPNRKIYIKDIKVAKPDGSVEFYGPLTYYIR